MPYDYINGNGYTNGHGLNGDGDSKVKDYHVVDLRSDTISKPTQAMRDAMHVALVGDDVYGEDPTSDLLIKKSCELFGKEDGIIVPTGTMANLIAIMIHCRERGSELICGDNSHTFRFEQGGPAQIAGVQQALVTNKEDGTFCLEEMRNRIREDPDCHEPYTKLIVVENTHNMCGGKILPLDWLDKLTTIAKSNKIAVHMDGARIFNAVVASKVAPSRIVKDIDSVCFCLSKSLGAPIGSVLLGTKDFIERAKRARKVLGGGMRQVGILAAAGVVALDTMMEQLARDHEHTYRIAKAIHDMNSRIFKVDLDSVQTNILMIYVDKTKVTASEFMQRLYEVRTGDAAKVKIRASTRDSGCIRFVFYWEVTSEDTDLAIQKIQCVIRELETKTKI